MIVTIRNVAYLLIAGVVIAFLSITKLLSAEQYFFSVIEDLPVMPLLVEDTDAAMTFESSAGRVAEVEANGLASSTAVDAYYKQSLPQLGWLLQANGSYRRGNELLVIEVKVGVGGAVKVLFHLERHLRVPFRERAASRRGRAVLGLPPLLGSADVAVVEAGAGC